MTEQPAVTVTVRPHEIRHETWKFPAEPPAPVPYAALRDIVRLNSSTSMYNSDYVKVTVQWQARDDVDGTRFLFLILCYRSHPSLSSCLRQFTQPECVYISCFSYAL